MPGQKPEVAQANLTTRQSEISHVGDAWSQ